MTNTQELPSRHTQTIRRALAPPLAALAILAGLLVWQVGILLTTLRQIDDSTHIVATTDRLQRLLIDMEAGERGYLVGAEPTFLEPYDKAERQIQPTFDELDRLVENDSAERYRVYAIRPIYIRWAREADHELALRRSPSASGSDYIHYFNAGHARKLMDDLRRRIDDVITVARAAKGSRNARAQAQTRDALYLAAFSTLLVGGLIAFTTRRALTDLSQDYQSLLDAEQKSREFLGATLASIGDGVLVTDALGHVMNLNAVAEQLTGWTAAEAIGKDSTAVFDIIDAETRAPVESMVARVLRDGITIGPASNTVLRRRDGATLPVDDSVAPIRDREGVLFGVILVFRDVSERKRQEAQRMADAEKNSRIAETLQRSLLLTPTSGKFPGLDVAMRYQAALEEAQLGGDFFDAFALDDRSVAFIVGDVTGKGLNAAAYTAEVKFALRAMLREFGHPANALKRLNRFLIESHRLDGRSEYALVALSLAIVDSWTGDVRVAVAGAEAPLVARVDSSAPAVVIEAGGPLLGIDISTDYEAGETVNLGPGDRLVLLSDGITESRRGRSEFFGAEGVLRVLAACPAEADSESIAIALVEGATTFSGSLRDDVCLVVVQRTADVTPSLSPTIQAL